MRFGWSLACAVIYTGVGAITGQLLRGDPWYVGIVFLATAIFGATWITYGLDR